MKKLINRIKNSYNKFIEDRKLTDAEKEIRDAWALIEKHKKDKEDIIKAYLTIGKKDDTDILLFDDLEFDYLEEEKKNYSLKSKEELIEILKIFPNKYEKEFFPDEHKEDKDIIEAVIQGWLNQIDENGEANPLLAKEYEDGKMLCLDIFDSRVSKIVEAVEKRKQSIAKMKEESKKEKEIRIEEHAVRPIREEKDLSGKENTLSYIAMHPDAISIDVDDEENTECGDTVEYHIWEEFSKEEENYLAESLKDRWIKKLFVCPKRYLKELLPEGLKKDEDIISSVTQGWLNQINENGVASIDLLEAYRREQLPFGLEKEKLIIKAVEKKSTELKEGKPSIDFGSYNSKSNRVKKIRL